MFQLLPRCHSFFQPPSAKWKGSGLRGEHKLKVTNSTRIIWEGYASRFQKTITG